jgi:hypothetical protein
LTRKVVGALCVFHRSAVLSMYLSDHVEIYFPRQNGKVGNKDDRRKIKPIRKVLLFVKSSTNIPLK